jgi:hypothetical protein
MPENKLGNIEILISSPKLEAILNELHPDPEYVNSIGNYIKGIWTILFDIKELLKDKL